MTICPMRINAVRTRGMINKIWRNCPKKGTIADFISQKYLSFVGFHICWLFAFVPVPVCVHNMRKRRDNESTFHYWLGKKNIFSPLHVKKESYRVKIKFTLKNISKASQEKRALQVTEIAYHGILLAISSLTWPEEAFKQMARGKWQVSFLNSRWGRLTSGGWRWHRVDGLGKDKKSLKASTETVLQDSLQVSSSTRQPRLWVWSNIDSHKKHLCSEKTGLLKDLFSGSWLLFG